MLTPSTQPCETEGTLSHSHATNLASLTCDKTLLLLLTLCQAIADFKISSCYTLNRVRVGSGRGRTGTQHGNGLGFSGMDCCADSAFMSSISGPQGAYRRQVDVGLTQVGKVLTVSQG